MRLGGAADDPFPEASLQPMDGVEATAGPVRVRTAGRREFWWNVRASQAGYHRLVFRGGRQQVDKELAVGDGFMRVSSLRPGWSCSDALMHPSEPPFGPGSVVQSIEIEYPRRDSLTGAGESWLTCWFTWAMTGGGLARRPGGPAGMDGLLVRRVDGRGPLLQPRVESKHVNEAPPKGAIRP